jgi:hypothetical protein
MKNQLAKTLYLTVSLAAGFFFALTAGLDSILLIDYSNQEVELSVVIIILVMSFLVMLGTMALIVFCNRRFDIGRGLVQGRLIRSRWAMTTVLMSMILVMITVSGYRSASAERSLLSSPKMNPALIVGVAAIAAIVLYFLNYHRFLPRLSQVERAMKRFSLNGRRFVFLREEVLENGLWAGNVSGEMHTGDKVCVIGSDGSRTQTRVRKIQTDGRPCRSVKDAKAVIELGDRKNGMPSSGSWPAVSGQLPAGTAVPAVTAENPRISAMLSGLSEHYEEADFMSCFVYDVVHGQYLVPAKIQNEGGSGDITEAIRGSHDVMFLSVSSSRDPDKAVYPLFTDWDALSRYTNVMEDEKSVVLLMSFQQAVEMMHKGYDGMVINPFGPASFFLSDSYVHSITSLEGYREEFINHREEEE